MISVPVIIVLVAGGLFWFTRLNASDCTSLERYDAVTGSCFFECTTDEDCAAKAKAVEDEIDQFFTGSQSKVTKKTDSQPTSKSQTSAGNTELITKDDTGSETNGTIYTVAKDLTLAPKPSANDQKLWDLFLSVAGKDDVLGYIQSFEVFDDSNNDSAASVWQSQTAGKWHVNVNAAFQDDKKDLAHTMVHEYGHIVSLNNTQVKGEVGGSCPFLQLDEGCANQASYINAFYDRFWKKYGEDVPSDQGQNQDEVSDFYNASPSSFVTEYAATNYGEDWAESWAIFVTRVKPTGNQEKDQKVNFFYNYPELVNTRNRIRVQIANSL